MEFENVRQNDARHPGVSETDGVLHLTIDTSVTGHNLHNVIIPPRTTSTNTREGVPEGGMETGGILHKTLPPHSANNDSHARMRAMSESERELFTTATGVRIPQTHSTHLHTQLTPPMSYSPGPFDIHNP